MRDPRPAFAKGFRNRLCSRPGRTCGTGAYRTPSPDGSARCAAFFLAAFVLVGSACGGAEPPPQAPAAPPVAAAETPPATPAVEKPRDVSLRYSAATECPDIDGYLSHVRSRARRLNVEPEPVPGATDAVVVEVEPEPGTTGWRGRVTISGERSLDREVRSERCADVVAALALITVLRLEGEDASAAAATEVSPAGAAAVDAVGAPNAAATADEPTGSAPAAPDASETPDGVPAAPATAPGAAVAVPEPEPDAVAPAEVPPNGVTPTDEPPQAEPSAEAPAPAAEEPPLPEPLEPEPFVVPSTRAEPEIVEEPEVVEEPERADAAEGAEEPAEPAESPGEPWPLRAGVAAYAGYASVPAHALKATLESELRFGEDVSSWAALLSLAYAHGNSPVPSGELGLTLLSAQLGVCPPAFLAEASVWLRACASVRGGGLRSTVSSTDPTFLAEFDQKWRPWLALGPALQVGVPLGEGFALRGLAELTFQLVRDRYNAERLNEDTGLPEPFVVYEPQAISIELGAGIGYSF